MSVRIFAPAKINLTLKVGRPRPDGRHPLQSVVVFADVGDWVDAEVADHLTLEIAGPFSGGLSGESDNLVLRAARALAERYDVKAGARISLEKNLPIASGIGGGSSDAAAALKTLNVLWALNASEAELAEIGAMLGADIPVCIAARSAYMTGTGETTTPVRIPQLPAVLVNPLQPLATGAVYSAFDAQHLGGGFAEGPAPHWQDANAALKAMRASGNDLSTPAETLMPLITDILTELQGDSAVLYAALSGSGATCFAILESQEDVRNFANALKKAWPPYWIAPALLGGGA